MRWIHTVVNSRSVLWGCNRQILLHLDWNSLSLYTTSCVQSTKTRLCMMELRRRSSPICFYIISKRNIFHLNCCLFYRAQPFIISQSMGDLGIEWGHPVVFVCKKKNLQCWQNKYLHVFFLADTFIQSNLQWIHYIHFFIIMGSWSHYLGSTIMYQLSYGNIISNTKNTLSPTLSINYIEPPSTSAGRMLTAFCGYAERVQGISDY